MRIFLRDALGYLAVAVVAAGGMPVAAEVIAYKAELKASYEIPPNQSKATGSVTISYDTVEKFLSWKGSFTGLSGPVTAAHFHGPATFSKNAGIALPIVSGNLLSPFEGSANLTDAQAADLKAGRWYVNLHTAAFPAGEIRGQVVK